MSSSKTIVTESPSEGPTDGPDQTDHRREVECAEGSYVLEPGKQFILRGKQDRKLTNFTALITAEIVIDDAADGGRLYEIEARLYDRMHQFTVPADRFNAMGWVATQLGADAIIEAGAARHVAVAIRRFSAPITTKKLVTHTGWLQADRGWCYIDASGVVAGGNAPAMIETNLPYDLRSYSLGTPAFTAQDAVQTNLDLLDVGDADVMVPLLGAVYRSVLGPADLAVHLSGGTGTYKSTLAGIAMSHFGSQFDRANLPASWSATTNSLETLAHHAKDTLFVIDDFVPGEDRSESKVQRIFRAQGNTHGRSRLTSSGRVQAAKFPRGLILSTGEAVPKGSSIQARLVLVHVAQNAIHEDKLASAVANGQQGMYAAAMQHYLNWLTPQYADVFAGIDTAVTELRPSFAGAGQHRRAATNAAQLMLGYKWFFRFATEVGVLTPHRAAMLEAHVQETLISVTTSQSGFHDVQQDEAAKFARLLALAFQQKLVHACSLRNGRPYESWRWGWNDAHWRNNPMGKQVGWFDLEGWPDQTAEGIYLVPELAYQVAQRVAPVAEMKLQVPPRTLWRLLDDAGMLLTTSQSNGRGRTVRRQFNGVRYELIHMRVTPLFGPEDADDRADDAA